jgi:ERF superfamily protein
MSDEPKPKRLVEKLCEIMDAVGYIQKRGWNDFNKYKYAMEADLVEMIRPELAKRKVFLFSSLVETKTNEYKNAKGNPTFMTDLVMKWTFEDAESGETRTCVFPGSGADTGDKGVYKALTGCEKYLLMKTFLIPTGDDPEKDGEQMSAQTASVSRQQSTPSVPLPSDASGTTKDVGTPNERQVREYKLKEQVIQQMNDIEKGQNQPTRRGKIESTRVKDNDDGTKVYFGNMQGLTLWTRDEELGEAMVAAEGTHVHVHLEKGKKPNSFQLLKILPD